MNILKIQREQRAKNKERKEQAQWRVDEDGTKYNPFTMGQTRNQVLDELLNSGPEIYYDPLWKYWFLDKHRFYKNKRPVNPKTHKPLTNQQIYDSSTDENHPYRRAASGI